MKLDYTSYLKPLENVRFMFNGHENRLRSRVTEVAVATGIPIYAVITWVIQNIQSTDELLASQRSLAQFYNYEEII